MANAISRIIRVIFQSRAFQICTVLFFLSLLFGQSLVGQTASTGALTGTVRDSSGAVVPNATVTATNSGTNQSRTAMTSGEGTYKFGFMPRHLQG